MAEHGNLAGGAGLRYVPIHRERPDGVATPADIAAARDSIVARRGSVQGFDIAVWGTLDAAGQLAGVLPGYAAAGATWWLESVRSRPGWLDTVRERIRREPAVQSPRGRAF